MKQPNTLGHDLQADNLERNKATIKQLTFSGKDLSIE